MSELILPETRNDAAAKVAEVIDRVVPVLGPGLDAQRWATSCIVACNELDMKKISDLRSVIVSAFNAGRLGLLVGGVMGHCFFVPRAGRCNLEIGYQGFLELAYATGFLSDCTTDVVLTDEMADFRWYTNSAGDQIEHNKGLNRKRLKQNVVAAYCVWHSRSGGHGIEVVQRDELDKVESSYKTSPWQTHYIPMCRKTPVRRAAKYWRKSNELAYAIGLEERLEMGGQQSPVDHAIETIVAEETTSKFSLANIESDDSDEIQDGGSTHGQGESAPAE